jgi:hypothetical protein
VKVFVVSHEKSEFGVKWMRFEADAAVPDLVRHVPHVAFIVENGAPIELLEFTDPSHPGRRQQSKMLIQTSSIQSTSS